MSALTRNFMLAVLLVTALELPAHADIQVIIEHNWCIVGPGGSYGLLQCQTGPGPFDAHTALLFGPYNAEFPVPAFLLIVCGIAVLFPLLLISRGLLAVSGE